MNDTVTLTYCGPQEAVEVNFAGRWYAFTNGVPQEVPAVLAHGGDTPTGLTAGLLVQGDGKWWKVADKKKPAKDEE
jgi:hypothetical protein